MNGRRLTIGWAVLLVAGCATAGGAPSTGPATSDPSALPAADQTSPATPLASQVRGMIPWSSETPAPPSTPTTAPDPGAVECRGDQLAAGFAGWDGATGSLVGRFVVWNSSDSPCRLQGYASIVIVEPVGRSLNVTEETAPSPPARPIVLRSRQPAPAFDQELPKGLASERFQWFNWCAAAPKGTLSLVVTLPQGGALRLPASLPGGDSNAPRCDNAAAPSTISVSAFAETPGPSPTDPPAVAAEGLRLALEVPDQATAGQAFRYVAELTNPSARTISLTPCPAYRESLVTPGGQLALDYVLNCAEVPSIAPGQTVLFAMEFPIPPSQPPSEATALVWELDPFYSLGFLARGPSQKVPLRIVAP